MSLIKSLNAVSESFARPFRRVPSPVWVLLLALIDGGLIMLLVSNVTNARGGGVDDSVFISPDTTLPVNEWLPEEKEEEQEVVVPDVVLDTTKVDPDLGTIDESDGDLMTDDSNAPAVEDQSTSSSTNETPTTNNGDVEEEVY